MTVSICLVRAEDVARLHADPAFAHTAADLGDSLDSIALHEMWETMHFALTGAAWKAGEAPTEPLGRAVLGDGGAPVAATDCGYGPGRLLAAEEVRRIAAAIAKLPSNLVAQRLLTAAGATPASMHEAELLIGDEYELFDDLKDLYADAAEEGCALFFTFG